MEPVRIVLPVSLLLRGLWLAIHIQLRDFKLAKAFNTRGIVIVGVLFISKPAECGNEPPPVPELSLNNNLNHRSISKHASSG